MTHEPRAPNRRGRAWFEPMLARRHRPVAGDHRLRHRHVYVLPTRPGLIYGVVVLAMLIASINYRLSLGYALSFLAAAVALVAMLQTWRNLATLVLRPGRADPVFAGDFATLTAIVRNPGRLDRFALSFVAPGVASPHDFDIAGGTECIVALAAPARRRGWHPAPRLRLETRFPLGLWRAWTWWQPAIRLLVYPRPEPPGRPLPAHVASAGEGRTPGSGDQDLAAQRPWRPSDSPRRIAWKTVARTASDELIVSEYEGGAIGELLLDWQQLPAAWDAERRLSQLTRWVLEADALGVRYALALPGSTAAPDSGPVHRARCLEALATWGLASEGNGSANRTNGTGTRQ
ncbi:MAG: DUF58 domain-containing protein [Burkholderiaceae bacterium]